MYDWLDTVSDTLWYDHNFACYFIVSIGRALGSSNQYNLVNIFDNVKILRITCQ